MANKKITDLSNKATAGATDILPIVDPGDNTTKRTTVGGLITALLSVIPGGSIITAMIANLAVTASKIDFSTFTPQASAAGSGHITIGPTRIAWGTTTSNTIPAGTNTEVNTTVSFPTAFSSTPVVTASTSDVGGIVGEFILVGSVSTTAAVITTGKTGNASAQTVLIRWIAIGAA